MPIVTKQLGVKLSDIPKSRHENAYFFVSEIFDSL